MEDSRDFSRVSVIYNPVKIDRKKLERSLTKVIGTEAAQAVSWWETTVDDPGNGLATEAIAKGAELVLAAGGDGTVRSVAEALMGTEVELGLIPSGTGNLLARNLHIPMLNLDEAFHIAFEGKTTAIDVGVATIERPAAPSPEAVATVISASADPETGTIDTVGSDTTTVTIQIPATAEQEHHIFLVLAGIGLDAEMIANTNPGLKRTLGWIAYIEGGIRSLFGSKWLRISYHLDEHRPRIRKVQALLIGNCGLLPANIRLIPEASITDGILDIVTLRPTGIKGWFDVWAKVVVENGIFRKSNARKISTGSKKVRSLSYQQGKDLRVESEAPAPFQIDGDSFGEIIRLQTTVKERCLRVKIPAGKPLTV